MSKLSAEQLAAELELSPRQVAATRALQAQVLLFDLESTENKKHYKRKSEQIAAFVSAALEELRTCSDDRELSVELLDLNDAPPEEQARALSALGTKLTAEIGDRSTSVVVLAELLTFSPWQSGTSWNKKTHQEALETAATNLTYLRDDDFETMSDELDKLLTKVRRKSIKWGRVATVAVVGAGVGVLTGGLAAPVIGGAVGGTMGLTGAAATSAGLAALGGGSLAAGGFGVFGGTLLLTGVSGVTFAGVAAAGTRFSPIAASTIGAEAVKLDLVARMVFAESPNRDEKIRRVVESLQESINVLSERTALLVAKIDALKAEKAKTDAENAELKEQIRVLKAELNDSKSAQVTLSVVCERLPTT